LTARKQWFGMCTHFAFFILDSILKALYSKNHFYRSSVITLFAGLFSLKFFYFSIFFFSRKFKGTIEEIKKIYIIWLYVQSLKHNKNHSIKVKTKKVFSERDITNLKESNKLMCFWRLKYETRCYIIIA